MTTIILTRHGHVEWHAPERFRERADLPLTEHGGEQARAASRRIGAMWQVTAVYSSPMRCSRRTAQIIAEPLGLRAQAMDAMSDIDYGEWQGLTPEER